jgi:hypothetical protein
MGAMKRYYEAQLEAIAELARLSHDEKPRDEDYFCPCCGDFLEEGHEC